MIGLARLLPRLLKSQQGSMLIETAIVAPVLLLLAIGCFDVSSMVARQTELQSAAAEAASIVRAAPPETNAERNTIRDVIAASTRINPGQITVTEIYRCGTSSSYVVDKTLCAGGPTSSFIRVRLSDSYHPLWTQFGVGNFITYRVVRTVQTGTEV